MRILRNGRYTNALDWYGVCEKGKNSGNSDPVCENRHGSNQISKLEKLNSFCNHWSKQAVNNGVLILLRGCKCYAAFTTQHKNKKI